MEVARSRAAQASDGWQCVPKLSQKLTRQVVAGSQPTDSGKHLSRYLISSQQSLPDAKEQSGVANTCIFEAHQQAIGEAFGELVIPYSDDFVSDQLHAEVHPVGLGGVGDVVVGNFLLSGGADGPALPPAALGEFGLVLQALGAGVVVGRLGRGVDVGMVKRGQVLVGGVGRKGDVRVLLA